MGKTEQQIKTKLKNGKLGIIVGDNRILVQVLDKTNKTFFEFNPIPYDKHTLIFIEGVTIDFKKLRFGD